MQTEHSKFFKELIKSIKNEKNLTKTKLNRIKIDLAKKYKFAGVVKNPLIIANTTNKDRDEIILKLNNKPIRELSGVTVVALFAKPHSCPHGKCMYCPGGPNSPFGDTPQSYTGEEPAALRAKRNNYDPYLQIFNRLEHYIANGHNPDKLELIFMGGTFPSLDRKYRDEFVYFVYKAINDFGNLFMRIDKNENRKINYKKFNEFFLMRGQDFKSQKREEELHKKMFELKNKNSAKNITERILENEIKKCETSLIRPIGLTIETKPDWALQEHCNEMLRYATTRLELGVQTLDESCLKKTNRGHTLQHTKDSFRIAKDMCLKINAHMMLGLPASTLEKDFKSLVNLFEHQEYRPDMLKIYPCLVVKGTPLYKMWEQGLFRPVDTKEAAKTIAKAFEKFPRYVRVMRVQRDIPTTLVNDGIRNSNLREFVEEQMNEMNIESKDIRAREIGIRQMQGVKIGDFQIKSEEYKSSEGIDYFIDVVDENDTMIGFIRLRFPSQTGLRKEINKNTALIRELHVYGQTKIVGDTLKKKKLYRYTTNNIGTFTKGKEEVKINTDYLKEYLNYKNKLLKPELKKSENYISYFTEKGKKLYEQNHKKLHNKMFEKIEEEEISSDKINYELVYEDENQMIFNRNAPHLKHRARLSSQHKGWGGKLLEKAEHIAKQNGYDKMVIISGVGVREYYRKFGYELEGVYMVKKL